MIRQIKVKDRGFYDRPDKRFALLANDKYYKVIKDKGDSYLIEGEDIDNKECVALVPKECVASVNGDYLLD